MNLSITENDELKLSEIEPIIIQNNKLKSAQTKYSHTRHAEINLAEIATSKSDTCAKEWGMFTYGTEIINYRILRQTEEQYAKLVKLKSKSAIKSPNKIIIKVHPNQSVTVTIPHNATDTANITTKSIHKAVLKRAKWIWNNIRSFSTQLDYVLPKEYVSGETQFYLGRRYMLKVIIDAEQSSQVMLSAGKLTVTLSHDYDGRSNKVKSLVNDWYKLKAKIIFDKQLNAILPKATWVNTAPSFRLMAMKKQWGSCSKKGKLIFNPHLVKAPKECIDYVILHELCHIAEHNHSEKFWHLLTQVMPNWKEVKAKLDNMAELYLNN